MPNDDGPGLTVAVPEQCVADTVELKVKFVSGPVPSATPEPWEAFLSRQMQVWRKDPAWEDEEPQIEVSVPKDAFIKMDSSCVLALPPDACYNTICDPGNRRVFKNIETVVSREVLEDWGQQQVVQVHQLARWRFLFLSGTFGVNLRVTQDREERSMSFNLLEPGFMKHFKGKWTLEPLPLPPSEASRDAKSNFAGSPERESAATVFPEPQTLEDALSLLTLQGLAAPLPDTSNIVKAEGPYLPWYGPGTRIATRARIVQEISPAFIPPPGIAHYLRGISANVTREMLRDFQIEAARLRYDLPEDCDVRKELQNVI